MGDQQWIGSLILLIIANILGIWRVTVLQNKRFDDRFIKAERHVNTFSTQMVKQFSDISIQITKIMDGEIRDLRSLVGRLDETLEESRSRVHDLFNQLNVMVIKVDRLERHRHNDELRNN